VQGPFIEISATLTVLVSETSLTSNGGRSVIATPCEPSEGGYRHNHQILTGRGLRRHGSARRFSRLIGTTIDVDVPSHPTAARTQTMKAVPQAI